MNEAPLISLIIPIYNTEKYLKRCIQSAMKQTYQKIEIILVDDGSTDESPAICNLASLEDNRVKVFHKLNGGISSALNYGLDHMTGDFILFLDGDDELAQETIATLYQAAMSSGANIACCGYYDSMRHIYCHPNLEVLSSRDALTRMLSRNGLDSNTAGKLIKSTLFRDIRFPEGKIYENVPVTYQLILRSPHIVLTGFCGYYVTIREGSLTRSPFQKRDLDGITLTKELAEYFSSQPEIKPYADCFYFDALVSTTLRAYVNPLDRRSEEVNYVKSIFKRTFIPVVRCKYLSRRQKILAILCRFCLIRPLWAIYTHIRARRISRMNRKKRELKSGILLIAPNGLSSTGGVERVCYYLHRVFQQYGEVRVITNEDITMRYPFLEHRIIRRNSVLVCVMMSYYVNRIKTKSDIVISNGYAAPFVSADVLVQHGTMRAYADAFGRKRIDIRRVTECLEKSATRKAKQIFVVAQHVREEIIRFYHARPEKIKTINNCVDSDIFAPNPDKTFNTSEIRILFCGRLDKAKGLEVLVQVAQYIEQRSGFFLYIATTGDLNTDRFTDLSKTKVSVKIPVNELKAFYNSGDVLLLPSMYEGFEMVTTESLSCGVPVIGNRVGAIDELLSKGSPGIYQLTSTNPEDILQQVKTVAEDFSQHQSRNQLHAYMEKNFSVPVYEASIDKSIAHLFSSRKEV